MKLDALIATWEEAPEDGTSALDIYPFPANERQTGTVAICVNDERFDATDRVTLREIIAHLQRLDVEVFGAEETPDVTDDIAYPALRLAISRILADGRGRSTFSLLEGLTYNTEGLTEYAKRLILYLGDSRRPDRELDLGRDDRTEAMLSDEEKALMPNETIEGVTRYYCTVQRRTK